MNKQSSTSNQLTGKVHCFVDLQLLKIGQSTFKAQPSLAGLRPAGKSIRFQKGLIALKVANGFVIIHRYQALDD